MAIEKDFQVDGRVGIAMDAMSASQKAALEPVLKSKEHFVAHANRPGVTEKLPNAKPFYMMKAGEDMRVIYTVQKKNIIVLDVMRKATADQFVTKGKSRANSARKASASGEEAIKVHKI